VEIYTIGFTKKPAEEFFESLRRAGIKQVIDVRLNNKSQLASFTKRDNIEYLLKELCGADYIHMPELSPTKEILDDYRKKKITWAEYEKRFNALLNERRIEQIVDRHLFDTPTVLLCSEPEPEHCHRRLVAEYLKNEWSDVNVTHL
jgi:uncharacterized protein (DUF488 family)